MSEREREREYCVGKYSMFWATECESNFASSNVSNVFERVLSNSPTRRNGTRLKLMLARGASLLLLFS